MTGPGLLFPAAPAGPPEVRCAGLPLAVCDLAGATGALLALARQRGGSGADVHICDSGTLGLAARDRGLRAVLHGAALNLPSGGVVAGVNRWMHRRDHLPVHGVCGGELFLETVALAEPLGMGHFLLGVPPPLTERLRQVMSNEFPIARIVGIEASPAVMRVAQLERQARRIETSGAAFVWIGLPTPAQHWHAAWLAGRLPVVAVAVADAFPAVAGDPARTLRAGARECAARYRAHAQFLHAACLRRETRR